MKKIMAFVIFIFLFISCGDQGVVDRRNYSVLISGDGKYTGSTPAGNLMASAIKEQMNVDIALYPSAFIDNDRMAYARPGMNEAEIENVVQMYPDGPADKFLIGNMKGSKIKHFIFDRISEKYTSELQVAGVHYDIRFTGGIPVIANFSRNRRVELKDDKWYKVAISNFFFFSGATFPGYKFRNGMGNYSFKRFNDDLYSARDSLRSFLKGVQLLPFIYDIRAKVVNNIRNTMFDNDSSSAVLFQKESLNNHKRFVSIPRIQGSQHRSLYYGHQLVTRGIVTAVNNSQWYPWGIDVIIQDPNGDGNRKTSDGIHIHLANEAIELSLGDDVSIAGTVYEQTMHEGLSKTSIRDVINVKINSSGNPLPAPVLLGKEGRKLPKQQHSSWVGNLNQRPSLNLNDGIDFWESLEGMRVRIKNPRVVGFRGGKEELGLRDERRYISLFIRPDGDLPSRNETEVNGVIIDFSKLDWNPEIMQMTTHHLTKGLTNEDNFNVGDLIKGDIEGVLVYEKNMFGGGDYMFVLPEAEPEIKEQRIRRITPFIKRPKFQFPSHDDDQLTIASYNVKNLAGNLRERILYTGEAIRVNLKCPDILTLVEIQDNNGFDFFEGGDASITAKKVISAADCLSSLNVNYHLVNIDPITHKEGGQPGGNIRVVMIYNKNKVSFSARKAGEDTQYSYIDENGDLSHNPGRVYPQHPIFQNTRRTLVSQFSYKGKKVFVLGNHLNSKLGDTSLFSAQQPFYSRSEERRVPRAMLLNDFVQFLERKNPGCLITVVGDFNAYYNERSMRVLAGQEMVNLIEYKNLIPRNMRYTTNHNGNSQSLDYIFVNKEFLKYHPQPEILHINSNFMGRISDHDPFLARFDFNEDKINSGRCGWKFLRNHQNVLKGCDVIGGVKLNSVQAQQCIKNLNRFMSDFPNINCRAEKDTGFTHRTYQLNIESLAKNIQKLL